MNVQTRKADAQICADFETWNPALFRDLLKAAAVVNEEFDVKIGPEGISLIGMDPSHEYMIDMFIPRTYFEEYEVHDEQLICLNLKEILRLVYNRKSGKLRDSTLKVVVDVDRIQFTGSGQLQGKKTYLVLEPMETKVPKPEISFKSRVRFLAAALKRVIGDCSLHERVLITVDPDRILFQNADGYGRLAENEIERYADDILDLDSDGQQVAAYKVEYLASFMRALKPLSEVVTLELSHCMPMKITAEIPSDMRLVYYVAPDTDIEHIRDLINGCYTKTKDQVEAPQAAEIPEETIEAPEVDEIPPKEGIDMYQALEDLGFFAYSGEDGDLYRKHGLKGWRVQVYWGALIRIQKKGVYFPDRWATIREFGIRNTDDTLIPEHKKALEAVKELVEKGTLEEVPAEVSEEIPAEIEEAPVAKAAPPYYCEHCGHEIPEGEEVRLEDGDTILCETCAAPLDPQPARARLASLPETATVKLFIEAREEQYTPAGFLRYLERTGAQPEDLDYVIAEA